jgi:hypothetical protein
MTSLASRTKGAETSEGAASSVLTKTGGASAFTEAASGFLPTAAFGHFGRPQFSWEHPAGDALLGAPGEEDGYRFVADAEAVAASVG